MSHDSGEELSASPAPRGPGRRRALIGVVAGLIAVTGSVTGYVAFGRGDSEQTKIRKVVAEFAVAADQVDMPKVLSLLCTQEAAELTSHDEAPTRGDRLVGVKPNPVTTSGITIKGDVAAVLVTRPAQKPAHLYLRKEKGTWKVCAPAGDPPAGKAPAGRPPADGTSPATPAPGRSPARA